MCDIATVANTSLITHHKPLNTKAKMQMTRDSHCDPAACYISGRPAGTPANRANEPADLSVAELELVPHSPRPVTVRDSSGDLVVCRIPGALCEMFDDPKRDCPRVIAACKRATEVYLPQKRSPNTALRTVDPAFRGKHGRMFCVGPHLRSGPQLFYTKEGHSLADAELGRLRQLVLGMHKVGRKHCPEAFDAAEEAVESGGKVLDGVWGEKVVFPSLGLTIGAWPKAHRDADYCLGMAVVCDLGPEPTQGVPIC